MRWKKLCLWLLCMALLLPVLPARAADTYAENEAEIYRFLKEELGINTAVACGILGNIERESSFNPTAEIIDTNGKTSFGLVQWNGGRFENLKAYCAQRGLDYRSVTGQLQFLKHELMGEEKAAWQKLQGIPDTVQGAYTAGYNFARYFERCWSGYYAQRGQTACDPYYLRYTGNTWSRLVFFDPNGGSVGENVRVLGEGQSFGALPVPGWGSNTFMGWYSAKSGGTQYSAQSVAGKGSVVLYARWSSAESFVKRLYELCLGRSADAVGLRTWTTALQNGSRSGAETAAGFFSSLEYKSRGHSDEAFVDTLYAVLLDRGADSGGRANWLGHLRSGRSRSWVFSQFTLCPEFRNLCTAYGIRPGSVNENAYDMGGGKAPVDDSAVRAFVARLYEQCLGRVGESSGIEHWTKHLTHYGYSGKQAAEGFVFSDEYVSRGSSDGAFVTMLYSTILNRLADSEGYAFWTGHLQNGMSRRWVFENICRSTEFQGLCASYGIRAY